MISSRSALLKSLKLSVAAFVCISFASCAGQDSSNGQALETSQPQLSQDIAFNELMSKIATNVDRRMEAGVPVPYPKDAGGGYTHEQHKQNGKTIYEAGLLYQSTGNPKYRDFARDILLDYAELYPTLGLHPEEKNQAPGKLFWQSLNEAVWLVYSIQGYDTFRDDLTEEERIKIENGVFNPMADFLSDGSPQTFDRIHNHGTWAAAAVGMTGYVLDQPERAEKALLGLKMDGEAGFLKQLDLLFSPDGYYAEGPYYQRYALMPFVLFSQAVEKNDPDRKIFNYRDGIVLKAIRATIQQSYAGKFFPINDAIREKGLNTVELKYALAIAYDLTKDPTYLGASLLQNGVVPTPEGRQLLNDIAKGLAKPFPFESQVFSDGPDGKDGALIVMRSGPEPTDSAVVFKATSQGLGHGHFDKLGLLYYDNGHEIIADYGAARFLNVEPKFGGRYLPENTSWAKQTVAHNTLVVDLQSHFDGDWRHGQQFSPTVLASKKLNDIQIAAAEIDTAYDGVNMRRILALVPRKNNQTPYVIDIIQGVSSSEHAYDLPFHYKGQLIETNFDLDHQTQNLTPLGNENGYQHLWKRAESSDIEGQKDLSVLNNNKFYTITFNADADYKIVLAETGANDPEHNLRHEQAFMLRTKASNVNFITVLEPNGRYDSDEEVTVFNGSTIRSSEISDLGDVTAFRLVTEKEGNFVLFVSKSSDPAQSHTVEWNGQAIEWTGVVHVIR